MCLSLFLIYGALSLFRLLYIVHVCQYCMRWLFIYVVRCVLSLDLSLFMSFFVSIVVTNVFVVMYIVLSICL